MSQATNYQPSQNVEVFYQKESAVGDQPNDTGLKKLQTTSFTIPEAGVPVEYSAQRAGTFTMTASQGHHAQGTKLWTFDTVLRGTPDSVLLATEAVFESGSSEAVLNNDYAFPTATYKNGASSASTFEFRFLNAGADSSESDPFEHMVCQGCVGTGFTLTQDIGSEGGELVCTINWVTGFTPQYSGDAISSNSYDEGTPKNIRSLDADTTGINGGSLEKLVVQSWELSVNRTIERIHYKDQTDGSFEPFGYAMTGGFEVSGSLTCLRNDDVYDLLAKFYDSNTVDINITEDSNFIIALDKCFLNEPSIDNGGAALMETIPFTVVGADNIGATVKMVGITIA